MINFKSITPTDRALISSFVYSGNRRDSNLSIVNLCAWQFQTCSSFAIVDGQLVIRFCFPENSSVYTLPGGSGPVGPVVHLLAAQAREEDQPLCFYGIVPEMKALLEEEFPGMFEYRENRDHFDYLYNRTDLAELKGKDYQPKRNHVNKFRKQHDYQFAPMNGGMVKECMEFYDEWCAEKRCDEDRGLWHERQALVYGIEHFEELEVTGGVLWVDGKIIAFTFGAPVNHDTFCIHAEKALGRFEGSYNTINQEFAAYLPDHFVYLNREEDLGLPGLRQAKQSYRPCLLLEKGLAVCPSYLLK